MLYINSSSDKLEEIDKSHITWNIRKMFYNSSCPEKYKKKWKKNIFKTW